MNPRVLSFLQLLSLAVLAWMGYRSIARVHVVLVVLVVLLAVCNLLAVWVIRHEPKVFAAVYPGPVIRQYLNVVCWCLGEQVPRRNPRTGEQPQAELLLRSPRDFQIAAYRAKRIVRGHDDVIDRVLTRIHETLTLRSRRKDHSGQPPLASFLLVGSDGIGKRYLSRVLSKLLYRNPGTLVFDCDRVSAQRLIGNKTASGELLEAVRRQPFQLVVLERIDRAAPDVLQFLTTVLTQGTWSASDTERSVSFANTTIVMTAEQGRSLLQSLTEQSLSDGTWHRRAVEVLTSETAISPECLNTVSDIILCQSPNDIVQAEVVAMLMNREAAAHGISLSRIEPEILMSQIVQITDDSGFALVPERVKKLLRKPLLAATQADQKSLSLRVRWPEMSTSGGQS